MKELIQQNIFLIMSLVSAALAAVSSGIVGTYVVIKRIAFIAGSLSHAILGGLGLFLYLERSFGFTFLSPTAGALLTAVVCALILGYGRYEWKEREDTLISIIWSFGMSIGIIFLAMTPGTNVDVLNYLFGNILWTDSRDLMLLALLLIAVFIFHKKYFYDLVSMSFDEKQAQLTGIESKKLFLKLLVLTGIVIVFLIKTVGAILVMSMLTIPTATACHFAKTSVQIVRSSIALGLLYAVLGIFAAFALNWPPGATITLIASLGYTLVKFGAFTPFKKTFSWLKLNN